MNSSIATRSSITTRSIATTTTDWSICSSNSRFYCYVPVPIYQTNLSSLFSISTIQSIVTS